MQSESIREAVSEKVAAKLSESQTVGRERVRMLRGGEKVSGYFRKWE